MIHNIGIDIIEVHRIKKAIEKNERFIKRIYLPSEIEYCQKKKNAHIHFAGRFAAKEALSKALQTGISRGVSFLDIEILNTRQGAPYIILHGKAKKIIDKLKIKNIFISISHIKETSVAVVVLEK